MAQNLTQRVKVSVNDSIAHSQWAERKWLWIADKEEGYISGYVVKDNGEKVTLRLSNETEREVSVNDAEKMNPPKFDKAEDMADLTYLNEASVIHNLRLRYYSDLIYTYSGLFLVTVNPYKKLPIYSDDVVKSYKGRKRNEMAPHIFAISDASYHAMLNNKENQSILITGESGAGKTENTKKVIQYLAQIACDKSSTSDKGSLELQILQANPILESFGNAQTIRNNNSSRFGKFIRIEFNPSGLINGANIEKYLLEKSRVTHQTAKERNYHIFYQLLKGASSELKKSLLLGNDINEYNFLKNSNKNIEGVDDVSDFKALTDAMDLIKFSKDQQSNLFKAISGVLHLGNLYFTGDRDDQAQMTEKGQQGAEKVCHVLGIPVAEFTKSLLKPKIKAGRDWVTQSRNVEQCQYSVEALARALYERMFGKLVENINDVLYSPSSKSTFIGVLDIAGFEIFEVNSFEQLCINYTNEKLQQFFNHHMFILEQEEYKRECIEWKFIDFGLDLQPTIDLIEKTNPIGILSCLDEECVMPKASDKTFIEKLNGLWKGKSTKYELPRFNQSFILTHYAGKVEYTTAGWLDKNKDPLNENITRLLANSSEKYIAELFTDYAGDIDAPVTAKAATNVKKGAFRTVAQRHKEQLTSLMNQLYSTEPHFVRCIIPNDEKKPRKLNVNQVLEQLRCNGVLEGIRICRAGFPNRVPFADFRQRYDVLAPGVVPKGFMDGRKAAQLILEALNMDKNQYRVGTSKVFFRSGVLAELEEQRDVKVAKLITKIQKVMRGYRARKLFKKKLDQLRAIKIVQRNARIYVTLREWAWWKLYTKVKPLLNVTRNDDELKKREQLAKEWEEKARKEQEEKAKLEALVKEIEATKKRIEDLLIQEKNAAADQAEILARTQKRELDLSEQLTQLGTDIEEKDALNDELNKSKKKNEVELESLREQIELNLSSIERLEKDKVLKEQVSKQLEEELKAETERARKLEQDKKSLETQLSLLNNQLESVGTESSDLVRQKAKLLSQVTELEQNLQLESDERQKIEARRNALEAEVRSSKDMIVELTREKNDLDATLKKKGSEIVSLTERLKQETAEKEQVEKQKRELQSNLGQVTSELENERSEREKLLKQKKKLEEEIDSLAGLMTEKGSEESKQIELRKLRENELSDLKSQLATSQNDLEDSRKKMSQQLEKLKSDLDSSMQETASISKAKAVVEKSLHEVRSDLEKSEESKSKLDKAKRVVDNELLSAKSRIEELENALNEMRISKENVEKQLASVQAKLDDSESNNGRLEREKFTLNKQIEGLKEEIEEEVRKRAALDAQKKKLHVEVSDIQARLEEEEQSKNEVQKKLISKNSELEALKERYSKEVQGRTVELEDAKRKLEREHAELEARFIELERNSSNLEKTKGRLSAEIEDLKLEIDREHTATRNAEKLLKQIESQLNNTNNSLENERRQREVADSNSRKLQSQVDSLQLELEEKGHLIQATQKAKQDLDNELKSLINEFGDGGRNIHELEKTKRRLELKIEELQNQLEEEEGLRRKVEEARLSLDGQLSEYRRKMEGEILNKDSLLDETRRSLMKEVNSLGEQLDEAVQQKCDALKLKKKFEDQVEELMSRVEYSAKGQSDLDKARKKAETAARDLQAKCDEEERARKNFEELSQRHEKKANSLQSEIEKLEGLNDALERGKKQLEKKVEDLHHELEGGDDSKSALAETKKRLEKELKSLRSQLDEAEESKMALEAAQLTNVTELESLRNRSREDFEGKYEKIEESRRALLASQRLTAQELEDKNKDIANLEKQKKNLQIEVDDLKHRLEEEVVSKGEEAAGRRKLAAELKELQLRHDAELAKSNDMNEAILLYKTKADQTLTKLELAELARIKAEKGEMNSKIQLKEAESTLDEAKTSKKVAEDRNRVLEEKNRELAEKAEESLQEASDSNVLKRKLQEEVEQLHVLHKKDVEEREGLVDNTRKKYQKEIKQLLSELEAEKTTLVQLKESNKDFERDLDSANSRLETELRASATWKKEKERLDTRVEDLSKAYQDSVSQNDELQGQITSLLSKVRDLKSNLEDLDAQRNLAEKAKKNLELKLEEINENFHQASRAKADINRSLMALDAQAGELRDQLEENQDAARSALDKQRRAELQLQEAQTDLQKEKDLSLELEKAKMAFEKQNKELNSRIMDLESSAMSDQKGQTARLQVRIEELTVQLESEVNEKGEAVKSARKTERVIRELQFQLGERDKQKTRQDEENDKNEQKIKRMKAQIEELESAEGTLQLAKRKLERESAEFKDKCLRLEKDNEKLKIRTDRPTY